jgi:hypothetical protein
VELSGEGGVIDFHIVYRNKGGIVNDCTIAAVDFGTAEEEFQRQHPEATWWEIGIPLVLLERTA